MAAFVTNTVLLLLCVHAHQRRSFGDLRNCENTENDDQYVPEEDISNEVVSLSPFKRVSAQAL